MVLMRLPRAIMRQVNTAGCCMLAAVLGLSAVPVNAAQTSGQFNVTVNLQSANSPALPQTVFCTTNPGGLAFGATVTVVCSTGAVVDISPGRTGMPGAPMHGGVYRYIFQASRGGDLLDSIDSYVGAGTTTSWRVVNQADRDYLEILVGW